MGLVEAGLWGLCGGLSAGVLSLMTAITSAGFKWPWKNTGEELGPRLAVLLGSLLLGAFVAGAAHSQMSGAWPAFIMGVGAPSLVRGLLSRVEVNESKPAEPGRGIDEGTG